MEHEARPVALDRREGNDHVVDYLIGIDPVLKSLQLLHLAERKLTAVDPKEGAVMLKHRFQKTKLWAVFLIVQGKREVYADHGEAVRHRKEGVEAMLNGGCRKDA